MLKYITTPSQFIGEINVPDSSCNTEKLQYYIEQHEPEILTHILGGKFYSKLQTELGSTLTGEWETLVNGGMYSFEDYNLHFKGLKHIVALFIYFHIQKDLSITSTGNGGVVVQSEAGINQELKGKAIYNWNRGVNLIGLFANCAATKEGTLKHYLDNSTLTDYFIKTYKFLW